MKIIFLLFRTILGCCSAIRLFSSLQFNTPWYQDKSTACILFHLGSLKHGDLQLLFPSHTVSKGSMSQWGCKISTVRPLWHCHCPRRAVSTSARLWQWHFAHFLQRLHTTESLTQCCCVCLCVCVRACLLSTGQIPRCGRSPGEDVLWREDQLHWGTGCILQQANIDGANCFHRFPPQTHLSVSLCESVQIN